MSSTAASRKPRPRGLTAFLLAIAGVVYGGCIATIALALSGGGHGWNSAWISSVALVLVPAFGVAWVYRRQKFGFVLAFCLLGMAVIADGRLFIQTQSEGIRYFRQTLEAVPIDVAIWAGLWFLWQVLALLQLLLFRPVPMVEE